jgi:hypothetical protein
VEDEGGEKVVNPKAEKMENASGEVRGQGFEALPRRGRGKGR